MPTFTLQPIFTANLRIYLRESCLFLNRNWRIQRGLFVPSTPLLIGAIAMKQKRKIEIHLGIYCGGGWNPNLRGCKEVPAARQKDVRREGGRPEGHMRSSVARSYCTEDPAPSSRGTLGAVSVLLSQSWALNRVGSSSHLHFLPQKKTSHQSKIISTEYKF